MTKRQQEPPCRWDSERGWLTPEHLRDCDTAGCPGCKPCPKTHCAMRGRCANHVQTEADLRTCPACIGRTRGDITAIELLYATDMPVEAEVAGVESEAFNLVGHAAAPEQYAEQRRRLGETYVGRGWCDWPRTERFAEDDPHHPYLVLGRWDIALREQYGPQTDLFVTVASAADYLRGLLAGPFPHDDEFEDFARDVTACRTHLEAVIHDSRTPELGRHCPRCVEVHGKGPRLRKLYATGDTPAALAGDLDTWHCPDEPEHWWSERDYRDRVASDYLEHATALTADQLGERLGVKPGTVRVWATREKVRKRGRDHLGRQLYDVEDATRHARGETADAEATVV